MIFIAQSGFMDPTSKAEWDAWYVEHLRIMRTVPGVTSAQRLETDSPGHPLSLAIYTVISPAIFTDPYYLSIRGMGSWQPLIDTRFYWRNLYQGLDEAPSVGEDERLLVADRDAPDASLAMHWLECVGLDRTALYRGIAVVPASATKPDVPGIGEYRPVTSRI